MAIILLYSMPLLQALEYVITKIRTPTVQQKDGFWQGQLNLGVLLRFAIADSWNRRWLSLALAASE